MTTGKLTDQQIEEWARAEYIRQNPNAMSPRKIKTVLFEVEDTNEKWNVDFFVNNVVLDRANRVPNEYRHLVTVELDYGDIGDMEGIRAFRIAYERDETPEEIEARIKLPIADLRGAKRLSEGRIEKMQQMLKSQGWDATWEQAKQIAFLQRG